MRTRLLRGCSISYGAGLVFVLFLLLVHKGMRHEAAELDPLPWVDLPYRSYSKYIVLSTCQCKWPEIETLKQSIVLESDRDNSASHSGLRRVFYLGMLKCPPIGERVNFTYTHNYYTRFRGRIGQREPRVAESNLRVPLIRYSLDFTALGQNSLNGRSSLRLFQMNTCRCTDTISVGSGTGSAVN